MQPPDSNTECIPFTEPSSVSPRPGSSNITLPPSPISNQPTASSSLSGHLRRTSERLRQYELPEGFSAATSALSATVFPRPAAPPSRTHSAELATTHPPTATLQVPRRNTVSAAIEKAPAVEKQPKLPTGMNKQFTGEPVAAAPFSNGYHFPPHHPVSQSAVQGARDFWNYFLTPLGFCVTIYGLNIVAWGGMLFLLLCNASPAMCHPSCNDINSSRRKWIEWDSQILNALFCVTGFGLVPWRFRDLYFLLQYRLQGKNIALRRLAGIHRGWFRLPGSTELSRDIGPHNIMERPTTVSSSSVPYPEVKIPDAPLTGHRAPETRLWKLDLVIWLMVWNTILQCCLAGFMWGMNRYNRPSWVTGLFVGLACAVAGVGGVLMFIEGKNVKGIEGIPVSLEDLQKLQTDREQGIWHYNNTKDKDLAERKPKPAEK